jgi:glycosyltransferase involved in cell wall biosynthesis
MKIVILGPAHPLRPGGITTFNERLCKAFLEEGHDCEIWSFSLQYPSFLFPGSSQFTDKAAPEGLRIRSLINSINPLNWISTGTRLRKSSPDLVVVRYWLPFMGPCLGTILRIARKNKNIRVVCIADNILPHEKRIGDNSFTRYFVKTVQGFIVMSESVQRDLLHFSKKPNLLLPHPLYDNFGAGVVQNKARTILQEKFGIQISKQDQLLVFFGLVRPYKGLDLLIKALALTNSRRVRLLVAGEFYEPEKPYRDLIELHNLKDRVILHNAFIAEDEVKYFICAGDCIIQPYKSATQSGVTPVAYHFEVPMIVTNVGGLPQMVPHKIAGLVCEPEPDAIAVAVDTFFQMGKEHFLIGLQEEKKKLSWHGFSKGLTDFANTL